MTSKHEVDKRVKKKGSLPNADMEENWKNSWTKKIHNEEVLKSM